MSFMAKKIFCVSGGLIGFLFCLGVLFSLLMKGFDGDEPPATLFDFLLWFGALIFFLYVGLKGMWMFPPREP